MERIESITSRSKYIPIIFFEVYLTFTVLLFIFGPWEWGIDNPEVLFPYLIGSQVVLFFGYFFGLKNIKPRPVSKTPIKLIKISIVLNLLLAIPLIHEQSGGNYSYIIKGFTDPGIVYDLSREAYRTYNITDYINIVLSPLTWALIPWIACYWKQLPIKVRISGIMAIVAGTLLPYISSGTNKGLFDILFIITGLVLFPYLAKTKKINWIINIKSIKYIAYLLVLFIVLALYFTKNIEQRLGSDNFLEKIAVNKRAPNVKVSTQFINSNLSPNIKGTAIAMTSYLCQGYYGCSLALKESFVPTYGIGNSRFLSWLIGDLALGYKVQKDTYPSRVSKKTLWDVDIAWSSIYPWFASDFTFLGTYIIVFLIGWIFARSWISVISHSNPWAIVVFSLLCIMLFYFSANNQILQTGTTFMAFYVALFLWRFPLKF